MIYAIFSDIHGNLEKFNRMHDILRSISGQKRMVCLGDITGGMYNNVRMLYEEIRWGGYTAVKGNCDYSGDEQALGFDLPEYRAIEIGMHSIHLSHRPNYLSFPPGDATLSGHTHIKSLYKEAGVIHANPGSVGKPRDDCPSYLIIEDGIFTLVDLDSGEEIRSLTW